MPRAPIMLCAVSRAAQGAPTSYPRAPDTRAVNRRARRPCRADRAAEEKSDRVVRNVRMLARGVHRRSLDARDGAGCAADRPLLAAWRQSRSTTAGTMRSPRCRPARAVEASSEGMGGVEDRCVGRANGGVVCVCDDPPPSLRSCRSRPAAISVRTVRAASGTASSGRSTRHGRAWPSPAGGARRAIVAQPPDGVGRRRR